MANNKNPNEKQPGEKQPGKFHYNPGNMSGKTAGVSKNKPDPQSTADTESEHSDPQENRR